MNPDTFPPVETLIPHSGELVLLDHLLTVSEEGLTAALTVRADGLYNHGDQVPAWVGMEYMAQGVAAFAGWHAWCEQRPVQLGFLLGSRRYNCSHEAFPVGTVITVAVKPLLQDSSGMAVFECALSGDGLRADARLNVFEPKDSDPYLQQKLRDNHE